MLRLFNRLSSFVRILNPVRYPSNRVAVGMTLLGGVAGFLAALLLRDANSIEALIAGVNIALSTFFGWAIGREIDPDHPDSANIASGLVLALMLLLDARSNLLALLAMLLLLRAVVRTSGLPIYLTDGLGLAALAGLVGATDLWVLGLVIALGFWADGSLHDPHPYGKMFAGLALLATLGGALLADTLRWEFLFRWTDLVALLVAFLLLRNVVPRIPATPNTKGDRTKVPLDGGRVKYGLTLMLLALVLIVWAGDETATRILPLWGSLTAMLGYWTMQVRA